MSLHSFIQTIAARATKKMIPTARDNRHAIWWSRFHHCNDSPHALMILMMLCPPYMCMYSNMTSTQNQDREGESAETPASSHPLLSPALSPMVLLLLVPYGILKLLHSIGPVLGPHQHVPCSKHIFPFRIIHFVDYQRKRDLSGVVVKISQI